MMSRLDQRYRPMTEARRLEHGYLQPGRDATGGRRAVECDGDVSCYASIHDDGCLVAGDPFRCDDFNIRKFLLEMP